MQKKIARCLDEELVAAAQATGRALREHKLSVVAAESCTAGLIAAALSQAEHATDILQGSFVTYTKAQKAQALGVDAAHLEQHGTVNARTVEEMAKGALARSPADIALAVSGVLGPEPDDKNNPVGLVWFCCLFRGGVPETVRRDYGAREHDDLLRTAVIDGLTLIREAVAR